MIDRRPEPNQPVAEVIAKVGVARAIGLKHVGSVLYTYRCTLRCRHCLFSCSPARPNVHVGLEDGLDFLRQLHATDRVIHLAGGEALMYYPQVLELCRAASREGIAPHFIETNASWCHNEAVTRRRLRELQEAGVLGLLISACPHHQHECPPERYYRCYHAAVEVFGEENVAAANHSMETLEDFAAIARDEQRLAEWVRAHPPRLVGRAAEALGGYFEDRAVSELAGDPTWHGAPAGMACQREFDPGEMWEIHIDPYGNLQTCCGIVFGNARRTPLPELMARGFHRDNPLVAAVSERGPLGLLAAAVERGYQPREGYPQKCAMCWELRRFLRPFFPETFGPAEIYEAD